MAEEPIAKVAVLADSLRRRMYDFIRDQRRPVSREEAATAAGISRKLAAFHLDKLVDAGLLKAHYARPPGRGGPGAGRTSRLYEPADLELEVSLPPRHYDVPAEILLDAVQQGQRPGEDTAEVVARVARERGARMGRAACARSAKRRPSTLVRELLRDIGYEPKEDTSSLLLRNCPFHRLAQQSPRLVCGMNLAFLEGLVAGAGASGLHPRLRPSDDHCCVLIEPSNKPRGRRHSQRPSERRRNG